MSEKEDKKTSPVSEKTEEEEEEGKEEVKEPKEFICVALTDTALRYGYNTTKFLQSNEFFHGVFRSTVMPTKSIKYRVKWILEEITFPEYRKVDKIVHEAEKIHETPNTDDKRLLIHFYIRNQRNSLMPVGNYKVEVFIEGKLRAEKRFQVIRRQDGGIFLGSVSFVTGEFLADRCFSPYVENICGTFYFSEQVIKNHQEYSKDDPNAHFIITWTKEGDGIVHEKVVDVKPEDLVVGNTLMFTYQRKHENDVFQSGEYSCSITQQLHGLPEDSKVKLTGKKKFCVLPKGPVCFMGTILSQKGTILDNRDCFPGNVRIIGLTILNEKNKKENEKDEDSKKYLIYLRKIQTENQKPILKVINFDFNQKKSEGKESEDSSRVLFFEFDQTKEIYAPGVYEISVEKVIKEEESKKNEKKPKPPVTSSILKKIFTILPRFDLAFTTRSQKNRKEMQDYTIGTKSVSFYLKATMTKKYQLGVRLNVYIVSIGTTKFPIGSIVSTTSFVLNDADECRKGAITRKVVLQESVKKEGLPEGRFELRVFMAEKNISSLFFSVLSHEKYSERERQIARLKMLEKRKKKK